MKRVIIVIATLVTVPSVCQAHFLWLLANPQGKSNQVVAYFSESASPDELQLLKKFEGLKVISVSKSATRGHLKRQEIELKISENGLDGELPAGIRDPLVAAKTYGVISRTGSEPILLKYYAKAYTSVLPGEWNTVGDADLCMLEVTPNVDGEELVLTVTWRGLPVAGDQVIIEADSLPERLEGETNAEGIFRCKPAAKGLYSIRARHVEAIAGEHNGMKYSSIKHYATLSLEYRPQKVVSNSEKLAHLPKGITSFGAAILDENLYVYGGHFGTPHHYSEEGQSNEFWRFSLNDKDSQWETLPGGPRLTGTALETGDGKLYRLGGFTAKNKDASDQDLWSQNGFAAFDVASGTWTDLLPLPEPRSSHDADIFQGKLYVLGGWTMEGPEKTNWLDTAWVTDLDSPEVTWRALPAPPFKRRALSVSIHQGKLYAIGGMQESGGPTTKVDVLDLATETWSVGPMLIGSGMEGFGNASFSVGDKLIATTISGSVQGLNKEGTAWELLGQMHQPRFFHRQLKTPHEEILVLGGASMATGKTSSLEVLAIKP